MCMHVHKHIFNLSLSLCKCKWERGVPALWLAHRVGSVGFELKGQSGRMELRFWCAARGIMEIHHKLSVMKAGFHASAAVKGKHPFTGLLLLPLRYFLRPSSEPDKVYPSVHKWPFIVPMVTSSCQAKCDLYRGWGGSVHVLLPDSSGRALSVSGVWL